MIRKHAPPIILLLAVAVLFTYGHRSWEVPAYPGSAQLDAPKMFFPLRHWSFKQVAAGTLPLWNPMTLCGTPNVAEIQSAIFYPPNLLFAVLNTAEAYSACVALHLFLAGATCYLLIVFYGLSPQAGLLSGLTYMLCGPQVTHMWAGHLTVLCVVAWAPLLVLFYDRAVTKLCLTSAGLAGVVLSMQLLAGYPQCALYAIHTVSFLGLCRTVSLFLKERNRKDLAARFGIQAVIFSIGFGLAAIQLFPAAEFVPYSVRSQTSYEWSGTHSLPPENLFSYLVPEFFAYWGREKYIWETCAYVGIVPLCLAMVAVIRSGVWKRRPEGAPGPRGRIEIRIFAGVFALSILLALARFTPLYHVAYRAVPGFSLFRGHAKYLLNAALALSVLAGFGLDAYATFGQDARKKLLKYSSSLAALFLLPPLTGLLNAALENFWLDRQTSLVAYLTPGILSPERPAAMAFEGITAAGIVVLVFCIWQAFCVYWPGKDRERMGGERFLRGVAVRVVLILLLLDVGHVSWKYFSLTPQIAENRRGLEIDAADRLNSRLLNENETQAFSLHKVNAAMLTGVPSPEGYVGNAIGAYSEFFRWAEGEPPKKVDFTFERKSSPNSAGALFGERRVRSALPRAFFLADPRPPAELPPRMPRPGDEGDFYPKIPSRIPVDFEDLRGIEFRRAASITRYEPNTVAVKLKGNEEDDGAGYLVLTDTFYPGWSVYVDGRKSECIRMYVTFRGVYVGPSNEEVELVYSPLSIRIGMFVSLSVLGVTMALFALKILGLKQWRSA